MPREDVEKAYVAGLFDGEGTLYIQKAKRKRDAAGVSHQLCIRIANTDREAVEYIRSFYGGYLGIRKVDGHRKRPCYYIQIQTASARRFLLDIAPFVRIKRRQVRLGSEFSEIPHLWNKAEDSTREYVISKREGLRNELMMVNRGEV